MTLTVLIKTNNTLSEKKNNPDYRGKNRRNETDKAVLIFSYQQPVSTRKTIGLKLVLTYFLKLLIHKKRMPKNA